uniref:Uncharacterized protein n=1 Tax=Stegastes partitus TaxID=144197 RepID=A0A3B4ZU82_9TELE
SRGRPEPAPQSPASAARASAGVNLLSTNWTRARQPEALRGHLDPSPTRSHRTLVTSNRRQHCVGGSAFVLCEAVVVPCCCRGNGFISAAKPS